MIPKSIRSLFQNKSFSVTVILTLTLGFGATAALFTVLNAVLLKPLPYGNAQELTFISSVNVDATGKLNEYTTSVTDFLDWRDRNKAYRSIAGIEPDEMALTGARRPQQIDIGKISANLFSTLGVAPYRGRYFVAEEEVETSRVAILSYSLWRESYGAAEDLAQLKLMLDGAAYRVIGVTPPEFQFVAPVDIWVPMNLAVPRYPRIGTSGIKVVGRLRPGVTLQQATSDMQRVAADLAKQYPDGNAGWSAKAEDIRESNTRTFRPVLYILTAAVFLLLLISCANVANLLLARAMARETDIAIRRAFGAGKKDLFLQIFAEHLVLTISSSVLGLALAAAAVRPLMLLSPLAVSLRGTYRLLYAMNLDWRVVGATFLISIAMSVIFSLAATTGFAQSNLASALRMEGRQSTGGIKSSRLRNLMVIAEVAMACILLTAAGWIVQRFWQLDRTSPGFDTAGRIVFRLTLPATRYDVHEKRVAFLQLARQQLQSQPGFKTVGASTRMPLNEFGFTTLFNVEGRPPAHPGEAEVSNFRRISAGYFRSAGIRLLEGRDFEESDVSGTMPVAIVSREFERHYWPGQSAVGKRIIRTARTDNAYRTIVGVVDDVRDLAIWEKVSPTLYIPYKQGSIASFYFVVATDLAPAAAKKAAEAAIWRIDHDLPVSEFRTLSDLHSDSLSRPRFAAYLITIFAVVGLVLAAIGVYGAVSYSIHQRLREIGIRMAIGGRPTQISRLLIRQGLPLAASGVLSGLCGTLLLSELTSRLDYADGSSPLPLFAFAAAFLLCVWSLATYLPARRAGKLDPITVLRY